MAKLFKRGRIWYAWVRRKTGGVKKVSTLCSDKRAAEMALAQLEREAIDPAYRASVRTSTQDVLDDYYVSRERIGRAKETLRYYRPKLDALYALCPPLAADISHGWMSEYVDARLATGVRRTTIKKELVTLKAALRLALKNGKWQGDPDAVIPELDDDAKAKTRALTPWELVGLASVLSPRRAAVVAYAVATGCDFSALWRARPHEGDRVHVEGTKRRTRDREVPLTFEWQRALVSWALARADHQAGRLFRPWANMRRDLALACDKLGIERCSANDLRRTYSTWLRQAGVEPHLIGVAMGHADSRMVERVYGRLSPDALEKRLQSHSGGGLLMGGNSDDLGARGGIPCTDDSHQNSRDTAKNTARRPGVEPGTRGFSVRYATCGEVVETCSDCGHVRRLSAGLWDANGRWIWGPRDGAIFAAGAFRYVDGLLSAASEVAS